MAEMWCSINTVSNCELEQFEVGIPFRQLVAWNV